MLILMGAFPAVFGIGGHDPAVGNITGIRPYPQERQSGKEELRPGRKTRETKDKRRKWKRVCVRNLPKEMKGHQRQKTIFRPLLPLTETNRKREDRYIRA